MNLHKHLLFIIFILIFSSSCSSKKVSSQDGFCSSGPCIFGIIVDQNNEPLDDIIIKTNPATDTEETDSDGEFKIDYVKTLDGDLIPLVSRLYTIQFQKEGFKTKEVKVSFEGKDIDLDQIVLMPLTMDVPDADLSYKEVNIEGNTGPGKVKSEE